MKYVLRIIFFEIVNRNLSLNILINCILIKKKSSVFSEFDNDENNHIFSKVHVRENLACMMGMELTYYSSGIFPDACVHCGSKQNLVKCVENYPRCRSRECHEKGDVVRRKRKTVTLNDLTSKKKK